MNFADSEVVAAVMQMAGYDLCDSLEEADAVFMNTCSIRDHAEQKANARLEYFSQLKRKKKHLIVGVLGCMAERVKEGLLEQKVVDLVVGPDAYLDLPNLITAVEIAAAKNPDGTAIVPEVCIFFENHLLRGNRTTKINAENFNAFRSYNYPILATAGIHIKYETHLIRRPDPSKPFKAHYLLDNNVLFLTLFPGIREEIADLVSQVKGLKAVILKTYGAGNAPQRPWLVSRLKRMTEQGMIVVNITQCSKGRVEMGLYETSLQLLEAGVVNGYDATPESMLTKLMFLLGLGFTRDEIVEKMNQSLRGEITID